jgi:hypothetical protein
LGKSVKRKGLPLSQMLNTEPETGSTQCGGRLWEEAMETLIKRALVAVLGGCGIKKRVSNNMRKG